MMWLNAIFGDKNQVNVFKFRHSWKVNGHLVVVAAWELLVSKCMKFGGGAES